MLRERKNRENMSLLLFFKYKELIGCIWGLGLWECFHAKFVISLFYSERSLQFCGCSPSGEPRKFLGHVNFSLVCSSPFCISQVLRILSLFLTTISPRWNFIIGINWVMSILSIFFCYIYGLVRKIALCYVWHLTNG